MSQLQGRFLALEQDLNQVLLERGEPIRMMILALLSGSHVCLLGPPGTAKSKMIREMCARITGARYWEKLLTRFTVPEELFGPLSLAGLKQDQYVRVRQGTLLEAEVVLLDETWKASSSILNALLTLMNERVWQESGQVHPVPLLILFGASNELPEDDSLRALWDRFLVRMPVMGVQGEAAWRSLGDACPAMPGSPPVSRATVTATVDMGDIRQAWAEVWQMPLSDMARDGLLELRSALASEGVSVSGRRWQAAVMLGRARAWLSGAQEVHLHHLGVMTWALWDALGMQEMSGAIATVDRIVLGLCQPDALESVKLEDAAWELMKDKPATDDPDLVRKLEPLLLQLKAIRDDLADKVGKAPADDGARIREAHGKVQQWHQELAKLALRAMSRLSL